MEYTMKSTTDYKFFDDSLKTVRRIQESHYPIIQGSLEIRSENSPSPPARIIREEVGIADCIFEATSYATIPGHGLSRLQELVRHPLPPEFIAFYEKYEKALAVTLTYPLYVCTSQNARWHGDLFQRSRLRPERVLGEGWAGSMAVASTPVWVGEAPSANGRNQGVNSPQCHECGSAAGAACDSIQTFGGGP